MVEIHQKRGNPIRNEIFSGGILNFESDGTLKITIDGFHQIYIRFDKYEKEEILKNLKPLLSQPSTEGIIIADKQNPQLTCLSSKDKCGKFKSNMCQEFKRCCIAD